eukprot:9231683-Alexandrium_andersonii.AAC.1
MRRSPRRPRRAKPLSVLHFGRSAAAGPGLHTGPRPAWGHCSASRVVPAARPRSPDEALPPKHIVLHRER